MSENTRTCSQPVTQPIIFETIAYQNAANTVYEATNATVTASVNGTRTQNIGAPIFKSNYERMQYLLGKQAVGGCGVPKVTRPLGTN
jgi:hypothetical protein